MKCHLLAGEVVELDAMLDPSAARLLGLDRRPEQPRLVAGSPDDELGRPCTCLDRLREDPHAEGEDGVLGMATGLVMNRRLAGGTGNACTRRSSCSAMVGPPRQRTGCGSPTSTEATPGGPKTGFASCHLSPSAPRVITLTMTPTLRNFLGSGTR